MSSLVEELESGDVKVQATALLQLLNMLATGSDSSEAVTAACQVRAAGNAMGWHVCLGLCYHHLQLESPPRRSPLLARCALPGETKDYRVIQGLDSSEAVTAACSVTPRAILCV